MSTKSGQLQSEGPTVPRYTVQGAVEGSGPIMRMGTTQPTYPGYYNCVGPCVYLTGGEQTVTLAPASNNMSLTATPNTIVQGDTVQFTMGVTGFTIGTGPKLWKWIPHRKVVGGAVVDSGPDTRTGVCGSTQTTCSVMVDRTGVMYVNALMVPARREQASAMVTVQPLVLVASPDKPQIGRKPDTVVALHAATSPRNRSSSSLATGSNPEDTVTLRVATSPKSRPFSSLAVTSKRTSASGTCSTSQKTCRILVIAPDSLTVTAVTTSGIRLQTAVFIDSIPCPSGDPVLDLAITRKLIDSIWTVGGNQLPANQRNERSGIIIDSAGTLVMRILPLTSASSPCTTVSAFSFYDFTVPPWTTGTMKIVAEIHTHPFTPQAERAPVNCSDKVSGRTIGDGPSYADWNGLYDAQVIANHFANTNPGLELLSPLFKRLVVDATNVWTQSQWQTGWHSVNPTSGGGPVVIPDTVQVGRNIQGYRRVVPVTPLSCLSMTTRPPSITVP